MKKKLKLSEPCSLRGCIERLQSLVDGLKAGAFSVEHGDQTIVLRPGGNVDFELRVDQNDKYEVLKLELGWQPMAPQRGKARKDHPGAVQHAEVTQGGPAAAEPAARAAVAATSESPPSAAPYALAEAEELELELEWEFEEDVATQRRLADDDSTDPEGASATLADASSRIASGEPELVAPSFARTDAGR